MHSTLLLESEAVRPRATGRRTRVLAVLTSTVCLIGLGCSGSRPQDLGEVAGSLRACPSSPNCVSSDATDEAHRVAPIALVGSPDAAFAAARSAVSSWNRCKIVKDEPGYLHVECTSALMRFVDDFELALRPERREIAVRSASRVGYSDMGVNRRRVEKLREELVAAGVARAAGNGTT